MDNITKIVKAIQSIKPNAQFSLTNDDLNTLTWENGETPISIADIQAQIPIVEQEIADAEAKKIADKESANAKLKALGLTDDEIEAIKS
jgi:ankyrin repeat protein